MRKVIALPSITLSTITVTLFANHLIEKTHVQFSSYDMPTKCSKCGEWHIAGTPCRK